MNTRNDFPIFEKQEKLIYLDSAATTQKPKQVIDRIAEFYTQQNANIHRGVYPLSEKATKLYDEAREKVAQFINAKTEEMIFTSGTTASLNGLSRTIISVIPKGKTEIVLTEMEHHANIVPWQQLAKKHNLTLKFIPCKEDFTLDYDEAEKIITEKTAIVSIVHVSNALGTINEVEKIIDMAHKNKAIAIVDAAQSVPHMKVDVKELQCDFLTFSGHKMLGSTGIGVLFGKKELLEKMEPFSFGGDMIKTVSKTESTWNDIPSKFEAGTPNISGAIALGTAIDYLKERGMHNLQKKEKELHAYALKQMEKIENLTIYNAGAEKSAGIISFNMKNIHPHDAASLLSDEGIAVRGGHHCAMPLMHKIGITGTLRVSFYIYNTKEDVDKLINAIQKTQQVFAHG